MALVVTSLGSVADTAGRSTYTCTLSRAPADNTLVLVTVVNADAAGTVSDPSSVSGSGLVFSKITSSVSYNPTTAALQTKNHTAWRSMGAGLVNSVVSVNFASGNQAG